jgi:HAD superfamily 5'-nucleotidase-like hydrolase
LNSTILQPPLERRIFANRTLNLRAIHAIGYDMDYTLIHYDVTRWQHTMYDYVKRRMLRLGWPVKDLEYDPAMTIRGLVLDSKLGNFVKPNRFGYVKQACHGTHPLDFKTVRNIYSRIIVDIRDDRWLLFTTLFDLPLACMYAQLVNKLDRYGLPHVMGYADLMDQMMGNLDSAYAEGMMRHEILKDPASYVVEDSEIPLTLLDQKYASVANRTCLTRIGG